MQSNLRGLYPAVYRGVLETDILADIGDVQFDKWYTEMDAALRNQFIYTADIRGIEAFERLYEIKADPAIEDMELRRLHVISKMLMRIPFTWRFLLQYLNRLSTDYSAELHADKYMVVLKVGLDASAQVIGLRDIVRHIIPANMGIAIEYPEMPVTLPINSGLGLGYMQTILPWLTPGDFEAEVHPASGMANIQTTALPELPDVPRKAYVMGEDGVVSELYARDETGAVHPVYINQIATWEVDNDA
jgi:hypothetical protein